MTAQRPEASTAPASPPGVEPKAAEPPALVKKKFDWRPLWMVGPPLVILAVIIGYPIVRAVYLSFVGDAGLNPETGKFEAGTFGTLQHYIYWLTQTCTSNSGDSVPCAPGNIATDFWPAMRNTAMFTVVTVSIETALGFWMAVVMGRNIWGRALLRAAVLVPWAIPTAVTAKLWAFIFSPNGIVNSILGRDIAWTTDPFYSKVAVIVADVW